MLKKPLTFVYDQETMTTKESVWACLRKEAAESRFRHSLFFRAKKLRRKNSNNGSIAHADHDLLNVIS